MLVSASSAELAVEGFAGVELGFRGFGGEASETPVELIEGEGDGGAEGFGGGFIVGAEGLEARVERGAKLLNGLQDFRTEGGGGLFIGAAGGVGFGADFRADVGEVGADEAFKGLGSHVEAG